MPERPTRRETLKHSALIAGCMILFLALLQGLLAPLIATPSAAHPAGGLSVGAPADNRICHRDDADPARRDHHGDCCILCAAEARAIPPRAFAAAWASAPIASSCAAPPPRRGEAAPRPPSIGWASSWSSRAPPFRS